MESYGWWILGAGILLRLLAGCWAATLAKVRERYGIDVQDFNRYLRLQRWRDLLRQASWVVGIAGITLVLAAVAFLNERRSYQMAYDPGQGIYAAPRPMAVEDELDRDKSQQTWLSAIGRMTAANEKLASQLSEDNSELRAQLAGCRRIVRRLRNRPAAQPDFTSTLPPRTTPRPMRGYTAFGSEGDGGEG